MLMDLSVVIPVHNEELSLPELYRRLQGPIDATGKVVEILFVNDGSVDTSAQVLHSLHLGDERVRTLTLSRNFGHQAALAAGLQHAQGRSVILMDGDLQDPPELIPEMTGRIHKQVQGRPLFTVAGSQGFDSPAIPTSDAAKQSPLSA